VTPEASDPRIDAYLDRKAEFARPILAHVRERVHAVVPGVEETLKWGAPAFTLDGKILLIMAAFKAHAALNFWRGQELRADEASVDGMGQFGKLRSLNDLPPAEELDRLIREAAELARSASAPRKLKQVPKVEPVMPPDFAAALALAPAAATYLDSASPSCRREYLEWIYSAKRDETRAKRIATAIAQLCDGKALNWKYQRS
jgi:uncharacterized protein YdeI (YjbR/CyaY-like superfamily)